jgi:hypothetical protein
MLAGTRRRLVLALAVVSLLLMSVTSLLLLARHDVDRFLSAMGPEAVRQCRFCGVSYRSRLFPDMLFCVEYGLFRDEQGRVLQHIYWSLFPFRRVNFASG